MENNILVFGDEVVDWIDIPTKPHPDEGSALGQPCSNWRLTPGTHRVATGGGTYLIVDLLKEIYKAQDLVVGPEFNKRQIPGSETCIQSYMRIEDYSSAVKEDKEKKPEWRVKEFLGYDGPSHFFQKSDILIINIDHFKTVIIDDAANGIRNSPKSNAVLNNVNNLDAIIYKLARPLNPDPASKDAPGLWETVLQKQADKKCGLVVLLDVNDLRNEGAAISHGLSWERFASDIVHFFTYANHLTRLLAESFNGWVIIKAGLEGAVIIPPGFRTADRPNGKSPLLIYNPVCGEDDGFDEFRGKGRMTGYFSVFTSTIGYYVNSANTLSDECLVNATKAGLSASRELLKYGFVVDEKYSTAQYPIEQIAGQIIKNNGENFLDIEIPIIPENYSVHKKLWTILETHKLKGIVEMAVKIVRYGDENSNIQLPCAKFGKLTTYDPSEIENFRTVKRLVREYLEAGVMNRPLSLAVFGKPGSGKSFGVTEVVSSLLPGNTPSRTFNLSEFQSVTELSRAFHNIHDLTRDGTMPLIFFDEFDCTLNGKQCGWLKYFLAPMQDGKFNDGNDIHPIGRAIFVFAGGTKSSYKKFADQEFDSECWFAKAKGPDFLSRLRGFVNIMGVDPVDDKDFICLIRRATLLRSNIIARAKTLGNQSHWLFNEKKEIIIEDALLHTLLKIPSYQNGARSLNAIIESCQLSLSKGFTKATLPPSHILAMHVDVKRFNELLYSENFNDKLFLPARETMARMVHQYYREANKGEKNDIPWEELSVYDQQQNRYQVDTFADLLLATGFDVELSCCAESPVSVNLLIEPLAIKEHKRWMNDKISQGFKYGKVKSTELLTHPNIVEWKKLSNEDKKKDREAVRRIPELLSISGFTIVKK